MLKCEAVAELVTEYAEGSLPFGRRLAMGLHLLMCAMCRNYVDQLAKTRRLLRARPLDGPAPDAEDRVVAAIRGGEGGA